MALGVMTEYSNQATQRNPACIIILVDQSDSMLEGVCGKRTPSKKDEVALHINRFIHSLVIRCAREMSVRPYYYLSAIGYGRNNTAAPLELQKKKSSSETLEEETVPFQNLSTTELEKLSRHIKRTYIKNGEVVEVPYRSWIDPIADGPTPMLEAFQYAREIVSVFIKDHPDSFPPLVVNITDGEPTTGDPSPIADDLKKMQTSDGNVLVFNAFLSSIDATQINFPVSETQISDSLGRKLFRISSEIPNNMRRAAHTPIPTGARGLIYNTDMAYLTTLFDIGTPHTVA